jgi:CRISPR-associated protein Cmr5
MSHRNTLEQGRAKFAYDKVKSNKNNEDYKTAAKKLPMYIKTNGLGAALAFMKSKKSPLYDDVHDWLIHEDCTVHNLLMKNPDGDLTEKIISLDSSNYRAVTNEVLSYMNWVRRFVD